MPTGHVGACVPLGHNPTTRIKVLGSRDLYSLSGYPGLLFGSVRRAPLGEEKIRAALALALGKASRACTRRTRIKVYG